MRDPEDQAAELLDRIEEFSEPLISGLEDQERSNLDILTELVDRYGTPEAVDHLHRLFRAARDLVQ